MSVTAYMGLGSNLGDRRDYLQRALQQLGNWPGIEVGKVSHFRETQAVGGPPGQGDYLNAAAELQTDLPPDQLLHVLLEVEQNLGRVRSEHHGPRTIDLDLLLYGDLILEQPGLVVPHPLLHQRLFVLEPLVEIAPQAAHPVFECTVSELLQRLRLSEPAVLVPPLAADQPPIPFGDSAGPPSPSESLPAVSLPGRELAGQRALVTGSTSGIGRAIALELAAAGADVIVHGRRSLPAAEEVVRGIRSAGVRSRVILADLSAPDQCEFLAQAAWKDWGPLDIWINNAGADTLTGEAAHWPFARKLQELLAVDVTATVLLARDVGRRMQEAGSGVIINVGWDQAETGMEGDSGQLFAAAKAAVMAFTKSLALTLAPQVRVNCLAPGWIRTSWGETASRQWQDRVLRETPLGRWGTAEDVAAAARWLVSPAAAFLTGQILRVNGGAVRS
ncbi:MAG: 2-amino-4-hydroxy-6-hydroxymethyldihydropteridine diphosphokinase [Planctomycetes bacterium]|nr:2-amino-4-hydroxy-6-hydroxymethyldihydropteridine diphosphokinase [Planctomycetota bacterium]